MKTDSIIVLIVAAAFIICLIPWLKRAQKEAKEDSDNHIAYLEAMHNMNMRRIRRGKEPISVDPSVSLPVNDRRQP